MGDGALKKQNRPPRERFTGENGEWELQEPEAFVVCSNAEKGVLRSVGALLQEGPALHEKHTCDYRAGVMARISASV